MKTKENRAQSTVHSKIGMDAESLRLQLLELADYRMPFGKYQGRRLVDLPEPYVVWFAQKGFPQGKLGKLLSIVYEIKANGLEYLFEPFRQSEVPAERE